MIVSRLEDYHVNPAANRPWCKEGYVPSRVGLALGGRVPGQLSATPLRQRTQERVNVKRARDPAAEPFGRGGPGNQHLTVQPPPSRFLSDARPP